MSNNDFTLTHAEEFKTMPWRNGLGTTIELLKHVAADERFLYRLSMATVNKDGPFSNFDGYSRTLVLLEGAGITLQHDSDSSTVLMRPLQMAEFDGGDVTTATLHEGPIIDFNIMARSDCYRAQTTCRADPASVTLKSTADCLVVYAVEGDLQLLSEGNNAIQIPSGSLLHSERPSRRKIALQGAPFIAVEFFKIR